MPLFVGRTSSRAILAEALRAVFGRRGRYGLAAAGVAIGTATVVLAGNAVGSVTNGMLAELERLGSRTVFVTPRSPLEAGVESFGRYLSFSDVSKLRAALPIANRITPDVAFSTEVRACGKSRLATIVGIMSPALDAGPWELRHAAPTFDPQRFDAIEPIAVIGASLGDDLPCLRAIPADLFVGRTLLKVQGELAARGSASGKTLDSVILVPIKTAERALSDFVPRSISLQIAINDGVRLEDARQAITDALRRIHRIPSGGIDDFTITLQTDLVSRTEHARSRTTKVIFILLSWAFLLGAVGVANALSAAIVERTSEIGLRRAVGAPTLAIAAQFLCEGFVVSMVGCVGGAIVGWMASAGLALWLGVSPAVDVSLTAAVMMTNVVLGVAASLIPALHGASRPPAHAVDYA